MFDLKFELNKSSFVHFAVVLFPVLIATVQHGGATPYLLLFLAGLILGWSAWLSLELWEKKLLFGFVIFFVLIGLSLISTEDLREGLKKIERYIHFPLLIPMYLLLKKYHIETGKTFLLGLWLASIVMFSQAFYQYSELGYSRSVGAYNPIILGNIAMLFAMIILGALTTVTKVWKFYLLGVAMMALALAASIFSASRGAWILLPVVLLFLLWIHSNKLGRISRFSILVLIISVLWGVLQINQVSIRVDLAISEYQSSEQSSAISTSVGARLSMWKDAVSIWRESPVLGTGIGDYGADRLALYERGELHKSNQFGHAHSIYFDVLATTGVVGFFAMLTFVFFLPFRMFYSFWFKESDSWTQFYALAGMITIVAFAVFGLTEAWFARNSFVRTYLMCVLVFMSSISVRKARLSSLV